MNEAKGNVFEKAAVEDRECETRRFLALDRQSCWFFSDQLKTVFFPDGQNQIDIQITADSIHQRLVGLDVPENSGVNSLALRPQLQSHLFKLLLVGMKIRLQEVKAGVLGLLPDESWVEFMRAGLLEVGEMQEIYDIVAFVHSFVAGATAILSARPER